MISSLSGVSIDDVMENARLELINLKLFGRTREQELLQEAYNTMQDTDFPAPLVLVHGAFGTGKSSLVETLRTEAIRDDGYFVTGKFDEMRKGHPYAALVGALADLCDLLCQLPSKGELVHAIESNLCEREIQLLTTLVYNLSYLIGNDQEDTEMTAEEIIEACEGFEETICKFLKCVASDEHPIVLLLDDLHFADEASMKVVKALAEDLHSNHVLVIGAFSDTEAKGRSILSDLAGPERGEDEVVDIQLSNLSLDNTIHLLHHLTTSTMEEVRPLAELVMRKTHGNPLFLIKFLEELQAEQLLSYESGVWEWNCDRIHRETNVTENVMKHALSRIPRLPQHAQTVLLSAAYLGRSFELDILETVLKARYDLELMQGCAHRLRGGEECTGEYLETLLSSAVNEQILESQKCRNGSKSYKFSHGDIRKKFYTVIDDSRERQFMHKRIGQIISQTLGKTGERNVCLAADQLNRVQTSHMDDAELHRLVKLNLRAAKVAKSKFSFDSAVAYIRHGIVRLDRYSRWSSDYDVALDLYSLSAEAEFSVGNSEKSSKAVEEVLLYGRSMKDKVRAYFTKSRALGAQGRLDEASDQAIDALQQLGQKFPRKGKTRHVDKWKSTRTSKGKGDRDYLTLPLQTDENGCAAIQMLASLAMHAIFRNDCDTIATCAVMMMRLTTNRGMAPYSPVAFATYAIYKSMTQDYSEANRFARLALASLDKFRSHNVETRVLAMSESFALHWKQPMEDITTDLEEAYKKGIQSGDTEMAFFAKAGSLLGSFQCGMNLKKLNRQLKGCFQSLKDYNLQSIQTTLLPVWQGVQNLLGHSDDLTELCGDAMNERELMIESELSGNGSALWFMSMMKLFLLCVANEYSKAADVLKEATKHRRALVAHFSSHVLNLFVGLVYISMYLEHRKRKDLVQFRKCLCALEKQAAQGVANTEVSLAFMYAERTRIGGKANEIQAAYDEAIELMVEQSMVHYQAIANDRAGAALRTLGHKDLANKYTSAAFEAFSAWGASAKVDALEAQFPDLMPLQKTRRRSHKFLEA